MNRPTFIIGFIVITYLVTSFANKLPVSLTTVANSSPVIVIQTIFDAAKTGQVDPLPQLLPSKGTGTTYDGDCKA